MAVRLKVTLFKGGGVVGEDDDTSVGTTMNPKDNNTNDESEMLMQMQTIPVLAFDFFSLNILWRLLQSPASYSGLILTSPRCVEGLEKCIQEDLEYWKTQLKGVWSSKLVFCVGPSTVAKFEAFNGSCSKIVVSQDGNAKSLGQSILQEHSREAIKLPLLYPCGALKRETLGNILTEANVPFECLTVYKTVQNPDLAKYIVELNAAEDAQLSELCGMKQNPVYAFYSPSGVSYAIPLLKDVCSKYIVAIGPTTKAALEKISTVSPNKLYQCSSPTNESLLQVLEEIKVALS